MNKPARGRVDAPISRRVLLAAVIGTAVAGCARTNAQPSVKSTSGPATVGQYASANPGSVNVFWLHTPKGLVVVDTGRALSDARQALARIRQTGKSVSAILLTHSPPILTTSAEPALLATRIQQRRSMPPTRPPSSCGPIRWGSIH
ncbi:MBL fold metallo-hydrolase [Fodinicola feengrottensis]|uniref:MBL fold metallo-hydrolase n=1 Tax=Fodinicola feengrottensis TaxID=435914 RepID=UPI0024420C42|nr:MBL fold metallo-hydrolase [Fodinicola feengrottensis]